MDSMHEKLIDDRMRERMKERKRRRWTRSGGTLNVFSFSFLFRENEEEWASTSGKLCYMTAFVYILTLGGGTSELLRSLVAGKRCFSSLFA